MNNFIKLWLYIIVSLCYCYSIGKTAIIPKGTARLVCFLPVVCLFLFIPLSISSIHLGGITAFFITWLANFKLLLFAFGKELVLALVAILARAILGIELEKQFDEPYLSASLQDFWGRRWNIMVTSILRPTVYGPVLNMASRFIGRKWAPLPAVFGTFVVSGIMHELIFYYLGRMRPTWEITWFFLLHGVCLMAEITLKKTVEEKWWLPKAVSMPLTIGFFMLTGFWFAFPPLLRCKADERALEEYAVLGAFLKNVTALTFNAFQF